MIHMKANTRRAVALSDDLITTGSAGIEVEILCSDAWDGLTKTVLFRGSGSSVDVILTGDSCTVPPEVLTAPGGELLIGLYGTDGSGSLAIPTVWADAGRILPGAVPSGIAPTPAQKSALDQAIEALQNATEEIPEQIDTALAEAKASGEFDGEDGQPGQDGAPGAKGDPGQDGISPDVSVTAITGGHRVTITDAQGTHVFDVMDGENGSPGATGSPGDDGVSPAVTVTQITGGHRVAITDAQGTNTFDVMDGATGPAGPAGVGVPTGGTTGQVLAKASGTNYDTEWVNQSGGLPTGGNIGQVLTMVWGDDNPNYPAWEDLPEEVAVVDFTLDGNGDLDSTPTWSEVDTAQVSGKSVIARVESADGKIKYLPMTHFNGPSPGTILAAKFAAIDADEVLRTIETGDTLNSWIIDERDVGGQIDELYSGKVDADWGAAAAGQFLVVNSDGITTAAEINYGTYSKPSGGIPKTDLASAVQTSLGKADTALQSYTETDPTVPSWAKASTKPSYTASEVGAAPAVTEVTVSTAGAVTQALDAGKLYHFTGALTALTITLNAAPSGQLAQYHFDFDCGSTAPTVTIPSTVHMPDANSFEASKHYEVDILNNYGAVISWANS